MLTITGMQNGSRVLCGEATAATRRVYRRVPNVSVGPETAARSPRDLLPTSPPSGTHLVDDSAEVDSRHRRDGQSADRGGA